MKSGNEVGKYAVCVKKDEVIDDDHRSTHPPTHAVLSIWRPIPAVLRHRIYGYSTGDVIK